MDCHLYMLFFHQDAESDLPKKKSSPLGTPHTDGWFIGAMVKPVAFFVGDGLLPPLMGILIMGPYKPLRTWVDEFIPYMEIMGVDRPWHI